MREPHIVPLFRQAVDLLRELHTHTGGHRLLFPNCRKLNECMTAKTLNRATGAVLTGLGAVMVVMNFL